MCMTSTKVPIPALLLPYYADVDVTHPEYALDEAGRVCFVMDSCIVEAVKAVWAAGMKTLGCCCGHGQRSGGVISLDTGGFFDERPPRRPREIDQPRRLHATATREGQSGGMRVVRSHDVPAGYWPCACVKRNRTGKMTHIKLLPPEKERCRVCGCTKAAADEIAARIAANPKAPAPTAGEHAPCEAWAIWEGRDPTAARSRPEEPGG